MSSETVRVSTEQGIKMKRPSRLELEAREEAGQITVGVGDRVLVSG